MDPNATLEKIRQLSKKMQEEVASNRAIDGDEVVELLEHFDALDEWLAKGGFPPTAWDHRSAPSGT